MNRSPAVEVYTNAWFMAFDGLQKPAGSRLCLGKNILTAASALQYTDSASERITHGAPPV
jgi:hypothetical protein